MDEKERLQALEREKERMINQYMTLQDKADAVNEEIYRVCCGIEGLNAQITIAREEIRRAELKAAQAPPRNGKHAPSAKPKPAV